MSKSPWKILAAALTVGGLLWVGARYLPLGTEDKPIITSTIDPFLYQLQSGKVLTQKVILAPGLYSGVVLYTGAEKFEGRVLRAFIRTEVGQLAATSHGLETQYFLDNDHVRLEMLTDWFRVEEQRPYTVSVELTRGDALPIVLVGGDATDVYRLGGLNIGGSPDVENRDLALSIIKRVPLGSAARMGVIAALITLTVVTLAILFVPWRRRWLVYVFLLIAITPVVLSGYWFSREDLGIADWDYYFSLHHYYREIILTHREFPFWNPYTCGGTAGLGDPEFPVFMPTYWLELLFDIPIGARLAIWLATATGAVGMLMLGKRLKLSPEGALLAALAVAFSSVNLLEITEGHVNVFAAMWIPWIFFSWLAAYQQPPGKETSPNYSKWFQAFTKHRWRLLCGIFLALTFYQGGIYLLMYTLLAFIVLPFLVRRPLVAIKTTVIAGVWALGLAAAKLLPVIAWLRAFPDEGYAQSAFTLKRLLTILAGRHIHGEYLIYQQASGWHEYGAYVGFFVLGLAVVALSRWRQREVKGLVVAVVLAAGLSSLGPQLKGVFDLLWWFPRSNISRVILFAVIPIALLAGMGLDRLRIAFGRRRMVLVIVIIGLAAADLMSLASRISDQAFVLPDVDTAVAAPEYPLAFTVKRFIPSGMSEHFTRAYAAARVGWGTLHYCSVLGPDPRALPVEDEFGGHYLALSPQTAQAEVLTWSPNRVVVRVQSDEQVRVALNTNMVPGWEVDSGILIEQDGRVAVDLPAGEHTLEFRYQAPGWKAGAFITLLTLAGIAGWLTYLRLRRKVA